MHHITDLRTVSTEIAKGLKVLKERIAAAKIPSSKLDETFNLATWNIREFGKKLRSQAAIHYIAEVLGQFDLIAVVELRDNVRDLKRVLDILGPYWHAVYSDAVHDSGGNRERVAYIFDKRQVAFNGLASAAFGKRTKHATEWLPELQWWRPPYMASFKSGNFDFVVLTTHIRWGSSEAGRIGELKGVADWVEAKAKLLKKGRHAWDEPDIFVMGDFNVPSRSSPLFKTLTSSGLQIPSALAKDEFGSNLEKNKRYDQILHLPHYPRNFTGAGGVLDFYGDDHTALFPSLSKLEFTFQMSDHLPLWIQVNTDIDGVQLDQILQSRLGH
jgi:endonuclease/exonuclease/phosphatase family metal-dependent hydrolase